MLLHSHTNDGGVDCEHGEIKLFMVCMDPGLGQHMKLYALLDGMQKAYAITSFLNNVTHAGISVYIDVQPVTLTCL